MSPAAPQPPVLRGYPGDGPVTDQLLRPIWSGSRLWWIAFAGSVALAGVFVLCAAYTVVAGIGVWGNNIPVAWAYAITNFVWWIGLGHAGTFISAFLLLLEQSWRGSVNRIAEGMTLFAIAIAGLFPILHLGRPWFFYWLIPYPATMEVWPNFRSTLPYDVAAVFTYLTISFLFGYLGLIPDLAAARDRALLEGRGRLRAAVYGLASLGWRGSARDWSRYRVAYGVLAGLATPLVISVHSVVSMDFAIAQTVGWHSTIFPPYFVVGAIYSGFALVAMLVIPLRRLHGLHDVITLRHLDALAKVLLVTGSLMAYAYLVETFLAWYSGNLYERFVILTNRPFGPKAAWYWTMLACNVVTPQLFWFRRLRRSRVVLFLASAVIVFGMWVERFVIVVTSLEHDFLPSSWDRYTPTWVDLGILFGTLGVFGALFLLFVRFVPFVPIHEVKKIAWERRRREALS